MGALTDAMQGVHVRVVDVGDAERRESGTVAVAAKAPLYSLVTIAHKSGRRGTLALGVQTEVLPREAHVIIALEMAKSRLSPWHWSRSHTRDDVCTQSKAWTVRCAWGASRTSAWSWSWSFVRDESARGESLSRYGPNGRRAR